MAKRKIVWTQTAARQRRNILEYWVDHNKSNSYSLKLLKTSNSKTEIIAKNPELFRDGYFGQTMPVISVK
ncbi:MAG: hypothetical protein ACNS60_07370 [Candidatus Cyclobacteriaceae bacterium M2_1C_046]